LGVFTSQITEQKAVIYIARKLYYTVGMRCVFENASYITLTVPLQIIWLDIIKEEMEYYE